MSKVLVTGGSGFVGSHLAEALVARGDQVTCLVRRTSRKEFLETLGVQLVYGDLGDVESLAKAVRGQEVVYHVAGLTHVLDRQEFYRVNAEAVGRVAEACAKAGPSPPVLVLVSSLAAAGPARHGRPRTEQDPPEPVSHYGRSKLAGEEAARNWADQVPITIVRPPIIFGPRDRACLEWFKCIKRFRLHFVPGWRRRRYSWIHIADLVRLLLAAAERGERLQKTNLPERQSIGIYFADSGEHPTFAEMGRKMAAAMGCGVAVCYVAMPVLWTITAGIEAVSRLRRKPFYVNFDKIREASAGHWICSAEKAAVQLGFSPQASLDQRLHETVVWYRQAGWL
ncbi:MAG: NAD-dependent epimerase/dehydratase family protein [Thermoguttaceae bacterium]|nr:NAD-dependent epimerase/dehydratase family protein [Thermoguttaceae bacterium]